MFLFFFVKKKSGDARVSRVKTKTANKNRIFQKKFGRQIIQQSEKTVRPMYMQFIEPSKRYADINVPRGGENRIAIDMIKAKMRELLDAEVSS